VYLFHCLAVRSKPFAQLRPYCHLRTSLQEYLEVELDRADGVRQLELVQDAGVQDAEDADGVVLAAEVDLDGCRVAGEEGLVWEVLANTVLSVRRSEVCDLAPLCP
jgi:hypothetical protein